MGKIKNAVVSKEDAALARHIVGAQVTAVVGAIQQLAIEQLHMVAQVRTTFDDESIGNLAESLKQYGQLQPIMVRPVAGGFVVVAGHRRLMAAKKAGWVHIGAIVIEQDDDADRIRRLQLVENLQRDELTTKDTAAAIRALHDASPDLTLDALATVVNKSIAWVSKRLSTTYPDFSAFAKLLMDQGKVVDIEIIHMMNQADKAGAGFETLQAMKTKLEAGTANRKDVRDFLDEIKTRPPVSIAPKMTITDAGAAAGLQDMGEEPDGEVDGDDDGTDKPPKISAADAINIIEARVRNHGYKEAEDYALNIIPAAIAVEIVRSITPDFVRGKHKANATPADRMIALGAYAMTHGGGLDLAAYLCGATKQAQTMPALLKMMEALQREECEAQKQAATDAAGV